MPATRKETLLSQEMDGELVLYDPGRDRVHTLNPTARLVWEHCDGAHGLEEIVSAFTARYRVDPETARADIERALAHLEKLELILQHEPT